MRINFSVICNVLVPSKVRFSTSASPFPKSKFPPFIKGGFLKWEFLERNFCFINPPGPLWKRGRNYATVDTYGGKKNEILALGQIKIDA